MPDSSLALGEPVVVPRNARCSSKALVLISLLIGLGLAALLSMDRGEPSAITMAAQYMQPATAQRLGQRAPLTALPGGAMQAKMYGIGSSPLEKLAMNAIDAANQCKPLPRDLSVMANMDSRTKVMMSETAGAVQQKAREMSGVTAPMDFFDPLGFTADCSEGKLLFYREVELKHGRVCMLASLGILVGENFHPLFGGDIDVPAYLAFQQTPLETFWYAVIAAIAIPEIFSVYSFNPPDDGGQGFEWWTTRSDRVPGDLGYDPLGLKPSDPAEFKEMQTKELNNGRLAMIGAAGMIAQELVSVQKIFG
jgi:hypothetical protein